MEMIIKINSNYDDVEVLFHDFVDDSTFEKKITIQKLKSILDKYDPAKKSIPLNQIKPKYLDPRIIGFIEDSGFTKYLVNEPCHKRVITYDYSVASGGLKVNFPSAVYEITVVDNKVVTITAYMYFVYTGLDTRLFKYGMPNMLDENRFCIGSAKKEIDNDIFQTLENIIYAPYSHASLNNVKGFQNTESYFKFLENNFIEEKHLYDLNLTLKDIVQ